MRRVLIVQYAGDYRQAIQRFAQGGDEVYHAQRYSVESVAELAKHVDELAVFAFQTDNAYDDVLTNRVRAIGGGFKEKIPLARVIEIADDCRPTHLVLMTPMAGLLSWAVKTSTRTVAVLADSFRNSSPRAWVRHQRLAKLMNDPCIEWVANHNINASLSLAAIGVNADKIIPWDWMPSVKPNQFPAKRLRPVQNAYTIVYAGALTKAKGVGDLLRAMALLKKMHVKVALQAAGQGEVEHFERMARGLGIQDDVRFLGLLPNQKVVRLMRDADAVAVPSRHSSAEGLPMTIYETLCTRTPLIASDHPMFIGKVVHRKNALMFRGGDPQDLANQAAVLFQDGELYATLSLNSESAWEELQIPVKYGELLKRWIFDSEENREWLRKYRLSSGEYS